LARNVKREAAAGGKNQVLLDSSTCNLLPAFSLPLFAAEEVFISTKLLPEDFP
jgi:hypothetical protein